MRLIFLTTVAVFVLQFNPVICVQKGHTYIQIPEPDGLYYYPYRVGHRHGQATRGGSDQPVYMSSSYYELGQDEIQLKIEKPDDDRPQFVVLHRNKNRAPHLFVYNVLDVDHNRESQEQETNVVLASRAKRRNKRSLHDQDQNPSRLSQASPKRKGEPREHGSRTVVRSRRKKPDQIIEKKVIHLPALLIDEEKDGFEHVFYRDMIVSALCLTNQPDLDRHEIRDEYEALVCTHKGYASILEDGMDPQPSGSGTPNKKRKRRADDTQYHENDADQANWHLDKNKYDILWRNENVSTSSSSRKPTETDIVEDLDYAYEFDDGGDGNGTEGWEDHEVDPDDLNFIKWPPFLPVGEEKANKSDDLRSKLHQHPELNYTVTELYMQLQENHTAVIFDRRKFALNDSAFLSEYYTGAFHLWSYNYEGLIKQFFTNREQALSVQITAMQKGVTLESMRQLFILFVLDVHHVNCFNRHIRFYGYVMKKPASINGDAITNDGRLTRGIVMRALELLRHVPQYNAYKEMILRLLIASLKERAASVKHSSKLVEENDYTELFEVASYLEYLLQNGIHPDEKGQDLFVQETRFYAHHFMNTLTLR